MLTPAEIRKLLASLVGVVADEVEQNPDFAQRVRDVLSGSVPARRQKTKKDKVPVPDPLPILSERGESGLRKWLEGLPTETLRQMIQERGLDPKKLAHKWKDHRKLVDLIVDRLPKKAGRGDVFRNYQDPSEQSPTTPDTQDRMEPPTESENGGGALHGAEAAGNAAPVAGSNPETETSCSASDVTN